MAGVFHAFWRAMPWFDPAGRFSLLKLTALVGTSIPAVWMLGEFASGRWDFPSPYVNLIYHSGLWCTYLLLGCLAVTPIRRITGMGRLAQLRRLLGVASFAYCLLHIVAWFGLRFWDWAALGGELAGRATLWIATVSALLLLALALTSFDRVIRAMGRRWKQLHGLVYLAALLAVLHFMLSPGSLQGPPFLMAGLYVWLMGWRWLERRRLGTQPAALFGLGFAAALFALLIQPLWLVSMQAERSTQTPLAAILDNVNPDIWIYLGVPPVWILLAWTAVTVTASLTGSRKTLPNPIS
ncbi:sulfoxide reductase heme-binding subunit YedZ [Devosia enhydra]|uniref:Sulfoxide reductase heme-binding subunit YedZ n=1 Tax=Devosia enhydra TaxID=665118 RepID=A0A1K2I380_9HYPH|nr:ferric reductase-like transmembrane domain-containing protein [Devosia enhydra]SFZ86846.1 sulfoxide reductase heme-binding subunit YedZ [Devosia enhydra]